MVGVLRQCLGLLRDRPYGRKQPLILINGLAEQAESWFRNRRYWERFFDVKVPEFLVYGGPMLQRRIDEGKPITVDYFTDQLELFLDGFVQRPPYHLVASSLGGQIAVEYAVRYPERVSRMVLLCPSGMGGEERLPILDGVRHNNFEALVGSVFYHRKFINPGLVRHYERQFASREWRKAVLRTVRGTSEHCVRDKLPRVTAPTLVICGREDKVVDSLQVLEAIKGLPNFRCVMIRRCGHAPQIERARLVNRLVRHFLTHPQPETEPRFASLLEPTQVPAQ
jgi:pimeloyl-ACP methyl ester carboxylesterase